MDSEMGMAIGFAIAMLMIYLLSFGIIIANYIMTSWALYTIADRRQIPNPWLAWLPVANSWIIGSIADDYDGRNGLTRKWRLLLLVLNLIVVVFVVAFFAVFFVSIFSLAVETEYYGPDVEEVLEMFLPMYAFAIVMSVTSVAAQMCSVICINKIFESTVPEKSMKYLIISLFVPLGSAICLMICKNKGYSNQVILKAEVLEQLPEEIEEDIPSDEE